MNTCIVKFSQTDAFGNFHKQRQIVILFLILKLIVVNCKLCLKYKGQNDTVMLYTE